MVYTNFGGTATSSSSGSKRRPSGGSGGGGGRTNAGAGAAAADSDGVVGEENILSSGTMPWSYSRLPVGKPIYGDEVMRLYLHKVRCSRMPLREC